MLNFEFHNPTKVIFGRGSIAKIAEELPTESRLLLLYGRGSIKSNGVYEQVQQALGKRNFLEFGGIEPNPRYETLMPAVALCRQRGVDFLLAVGGGSVLDGTKFVAAAACYEGKDPWEILAQREVPGRALPLGAVLTLPATGSESNGFAVVSREATGEKLAFFSPAVYPRFAVLDPETTLSLPPQQIANGVVDAFVHVMEQYCTYPVNSPLQDRQAEAVLLTLIAEGPKTLRDPQNYEARANLMWSATNALNGTLSCGVPGDWATHMIGHELTALYGIDHAQSLAIVLPALLRQQRAKKLLKLAQYGRRVWGLGEGSDEVVAQKAIEKTQGFFESLGVKTCLSYYDIDERVCEQVADRLSKRGSKIGENQDIGRDEIIKILKMAL